MNADAHREGFRILRSDPALLAMELLWRWSFGLGLLALLFVAYAHLRQVVFLSDADQMALNWPGSFRLGRCRRDLLAEAMPLLLRTARRRSSAWRAVLWIAAATLGRGIITRVMVRRFAADYGLPIAPDAPRWSSFATSQVCSRADAADSRHRLSGRHMDRRAGQLERSRTSSPPRSSSSLRSLPPACSGAMSTGCFRWRRSSSCATRSRHWIQWSQPSPLSAATACA